MRALALRITNFKSFKGQQVFTFPREAGLYFIRGVNESEPRLGGNATGKTTLWDALTWCVHDKTTRGAKAGDVSNWDVQKGTEVEFDFEFDGDPCVWTIKRTWKPNTWTLAHLAEYVTDEAVIDLTKDATNPVLAELRVSFEAWLQSVLIAQRKAMFLDLKPDAQAKLFSEVLGLERWMEYSLRASKKANEQDAASRVLERDLARCEGELRALDVSDHQPKREEWEDDRHRKLANLTDSFATLMDRRDTLKHALEAAQKRETEAREGLHTTELDPELVDRVNEVRRDAAESRDLLMRLKGKLEDAERPEKRGDTCPTCGQPWSWKQAHAHEEEENERYATLVSQVEKEGRAQRELTEVMRDLEDELDKRRAKVRAAEDELDVARRGMGNARRDYDLNERELDRIEDAAEDLEKQVNPWEQMEEDARRQGKRLREELEALRVKLDESHSRYELLSFWVKGFKDVRLQEIAEALTELEIEVNSAMTSLGLVDWEMGFAVDKETKAGGVSRGFAVTVKSPLQPFATPWESWSGGETQRLCVAGNMGLADLTRSRTGLALNFEVWDEPTAGLSPEGITDLLDCLAERARIEGRLIFIVDHKAHDFGGFSGQYTIVKTPSGSRIRDGAYN